MTAPADPLSAACVPHDVASCRRAPRLPLLRTFALAALLSGFGAPGCAQSPSAMTDATAPAPVSAAPGPGAPVVDGRYRNRFPGGESRGSFWKWQWERWTQGLPKTPAEGWRFDTVRPDVAWVQANRATDALVWIGHATFLVQIAGLNVLTDPHLTQRASPVGFAGPKRLVPPGLDFHELPHIDAVVISHNHYDHLDLGTVVRLGQQAGGAPRYYVPKGMKAWFADQGLTDVVELDWWQSATLGSVRFTFTPVQHWSSRTVLDRNRSLWGGWRLDAPELSVFFAGDTGYSQDFEDIRARLGPVDLALLPIGAYDPRWFMQVMHVNPDEAVRIHRDLGAGQSVAMHWGTFVLTDEPMDEPPQRLLAALDAAGVSRERFRVMQHGELRRFASTFRGP